MMTRHDTAARLRLQIRGAVQGVGFRPFVYRLARELALKGWVTNSTAGVQIEAEGPWEALERFRARLRDSPPCRASIHHVEEAVLDPAGYSTFTIRVSDGAGTATALVTPDIAICEECSRELFDPSNRRYLYPFINCTNCGPRYSIIKALPYDRPNTTMKRFELCDECREEYEDPHNRRFHAQPNACPACGPQVELLGADGVRLATHDEAVHVARKALLEGQIVAIKGLGGFQLLVNACDDKAVCRLRTRKHREEKPLAIMVRDLAAARAHCDVSTIEVQLLASPEAPIVLLRRISNRVCSAVAPGNPYIGVMRAYTPLHQLLLHEVAFPVVATSGNLTDEPLCIDNDEALGRLRRVADFFLMHDRPIARRVDDSVVRVVAGRPLLLRRARGYAPLPISLKHPLPPVLAVGAQQKNTTAISIGRDVFLGPHLGDLESPEAYDAFCQSLAGWKQLYHFRAERVACDLHPDYRSTRHATQLGIRSHGVQHHFAHALSCMAENGIDPPVLAVVWDGTGYGLDGTIWGGEFLRISDRGFERFDHLRTFRLPGGDSAAREPRRAALGVLYETFGRNAPAFPGFDQREADILLTMIQKGVNAPLTSSAGRLFDAVAAILRLRERSNFEGQAAMDLEFAAEPGERPYGDTSTDWTAIIRAMVNDLQNGVPRGRIAGRFHESLADIIVQVARKADLPRVLLTGGCFQNKVLTERTIDRLREAGFAVYWHQQVPPNDGGIALGQVVAASSE